MLQNRSLVKQTPNYMCQYSVLAPKEIPPVEEDSTLNRALGVAGWDSIFSECGCYWQKYSETSKQLPAFSSDYWATGIAFNSLLIITKTCNIPFHSFEDPLPSQKPFKQQCFISINPHILDSDSPLSFRVDTELQNGPCLLLGNSIPLSIKITKLGDSQCKVFLSAFQTMLVETTQVKVQGTTESSTSTWIVQSMANINYPIGLADAPTDTTVSLRDVIWANNRLPPEVTSSFEVCNIKRMYKLNLRLAFLVGESKVNTEKILTLLDYLDHG